MLDTSRHWFPVGALEATIEAMAYAKLNVFHWHFWQWAVKSSMHRPIYFLSYSV